MLILLAVVGVGHIPRVRASTPEYVALGPEELKAALPQAPASPAPGPQPRASLSISKTAPLESLPFWRRKPELMRRLKEERAVIVSVKREETHGAKKQIHLTIQGVGVVARAKDICFQLAQQFHRLPEVSDHFRQATFDPATSELFLIVQALGWQARMIVKVTPVSEDWRSELQWEVIWGHFKGMKGLIGFERTDGDRTEMSVSAHYEAAELPLPKSLLGFTLEVVIQKAAEKMRSFLENEPAPVSEKTVKTEAPQTTIESHAVTAPATPRPANSHRR